jgi:hypothetical protein
MKITKHISLTNKALTINKTTVLTNLESESFTIFLKSIYNKFEINYPKYFKMDKLSKLGFLSTEILLHQENLKNKYKPNEIAIIISNSSSTIDVDSKFYNSVIDKEGIPSPSLFVYTLPNIMIGEICIKNEIRGEIALLVSEKFNSNLIYSYLSDVFENNKKIKAGITGWVEIDKKDNFNANLFLVELIENTKNNYTFDNDNLKTNFTE